MDSSARLALSSVLFAFAAAYFLYSGFTTPTVVETEAGEMANFQLLQIQALNFWLGIGSAIISALLAVGSSIVGALSSGAE